MVVGRSRRSETRSPKHERTAATLIAGATYLMKIVDLKTFRVRPRWIFLRVDTDEGIVGWGEPGAEARVGAVEAAVDELRDYLVGQNPLAVERIWQTLTT